MLFIIFCVMGTGRQLDDMRILFFYFFDCFGNKLLADSFPLPVWQYINPKYLIDIIIHPRLSKTYETDYLTPVLCHIVNRSDGGITEHTLHFEHRFLLPGLRVITADYSPGGIYIALF